MATDFSLFFMTMVASRTGFRLISAITRVVTSSAVCVGAYSLHDLNQRTRNTVEFMESGTGAFLNMVEAKTGRREFEPLITDMINQTQYIGE